MYSKSKQLLGSSHWKHGLNNLDSEKYIQQMAYRACSRYFLPTARVSGIFNTRTTPLCRAWKMRIASSHCRFVIFRRSSRAVQSKHKARRFLRHTHTWTWGLCRTRDSAPSLPLRRSKRHLNVAHLPSGMSEATSDGVPSRVRYGVPSECDWARRFRNSFTFGTAS